MHNKADPRSCPEECCRWCHGVIISQLHYRQLPLINWLFKTISQWISPAVTEPIRRNTQSSLLNKCMAASRLLHFSWSSATCIQVFILLQPEKHRNFENLDWLAWNISSQIGRYCKSLWFWGCFALSLINKSVTLVGQDVSRYQGRRSKNSVKEYNVKLETKGCTDRRLCDLMSLVISKGY